VKTMAHMGYTARVEYDEGDNVYFGRILGIRAVISFHGETVDQLHGEFVAAVDDYLADCEASALRPETPARP
jgi:predicted HicB family RNase H-like nuclease